MKKWLIIILMVFAMVETVDALCWNPLELFCIFGEEVTTSSSITLFAQLEQPQQSSGGTITINSFTQPRYTDLNCNRQGNTLNFSWSGKYTAIDINFYYAGNGKIYTPTEALSF